MKKMGFFGVVVCSFLCAIANAQLKSNATARKLVLLDGYFNHEFKKDATGAMVPYHYTWDDKANSGFSQLGEVFLSKGASTAMLHAAPLRQNLKQASVYIIVDPDTRYETPHPNYVTTRDANEVYDWVKAGGVLLLMLNDSGNAEFTHFNILAEKFGIHFNENGRNEVIGNHFETGALQLPAQHFIFTSGPKVYIKGISTLKITPPAKAAFTDNGDVIMAVAKVGKGTVFAVGDPWFYNEYIDNKNLPSYFQNYKAANELVTWLLLQAK